VACLFPILLPDCYEPQEIHMKNRMKQLLAMLGVALLAGGVQAQDTKTHKKLAPKSASKHKAAKPAEKPTAVLDDDGKEFNAAGESVTEVACELGNKLTLYRNAEDTDHLALRWKQRVHRMTRVSTTTGANRFENDRFGLVWIGIPAKGMLLDSKHGQQLANECKDAEQMAPKPVAPIEPTRPADLPPPIEAPRADGKKVS
jgi:hypothetical protein